MNFKTPFERKTAERLLANKIEEVHRHAGYLQNDIEPYYAQKSTKFTEMCDDYLIYVSELLQDIESNLARIEIITDQVQQETEDNVPHNADGVIACSCALPKKEPKAKYGKE